MQALGPELNSPGVRALLNSRHFVTGQGKDVFGKMHPVLADYLRRFTHCNESDEMIVACNAFLAGAASEIVGAPEDSYKLDVYRKHGDFLYGALQSAAEVPASLAAQMAFALSQLCSWQSDTRAAKCFASESYDLSRRTAGENAAETIVVMREFATALQADGDYSDARQVLERLVDILKSSLGIDHPDVLSALSQLAHTLSAQGELSSARTLNTTVLETRRSLFSENDPSVLGSMADLAFTMFEQGEFKESRILLEEVIDKRRLRGDHDVDMLRLFNNLAQVYRLQGDLKAARELLESLARDTVELHGKEHLESLQARHNLASILWRLGESLEAHRIEQEAVQGLQRVLGDSHPKTLSAKNVLAEILRASGDLAAARALQETVLNDRLRVLGEQHPDTLISMNNLAGTLHMLGEIERCQELMMQLIVVQERVLGSEHPEVLNSRSNFATYTTDRAIAQRALEACLADERRGLGEEHPYTLATMNNLALCHNENGKPAKARQLLEQSVAVGARVLGVEHPSFTNMLKGLISLLCQHGDFDAAYETARNILGEEHSQTIVQAELLAGFLFMEKRDLVGARHLQEMVLEKRVATQGKNHPDTVRVARNLFALLGVQGDRKELRKLQARWRRKIPQK